MSLLPARGAGLGQVFRIPEFRALRFAELVSVARDQLARVGLSVLVHAPSATARASEFPTVDVVRVRG